MYTCLMFYHFQFDRLKTALIEYYKQENKDTSNEIEEPGKEREKNIENIAEENVSILYVM